MARQIIILGVSSYAGGENSVNCIFWYPVTAGQELPLPGFTSQYKGASASDISALQSGTMVEEMRTYSIPATYTLAQAEAFLLALYNAKVTYRGTQIAVGNFYGFNYDGAAWNNVHG